MEEELDPLDAFMASLQNETSVKAPSLSKNPQKSFNDSSSQKKHSIQPPFIDTYPSDEDDEKTAEADAGNTSSLNLLSAADIIASAQRKLKKKDFLVTDHSTIDYESFKKDFLVVSPDIATMREDQVAAYRLELGLKVKVHHTKWIFFINIFIFLFLGSAMSAADKKVYTMRVVPKNHVCDYAQVRV